MSTRSMIIRENLDGSYDTIYCHWDGYPSNNGRLLLGYWNTPELVGALIKLGDLSSLGTRIGTKHDFDKWDSNGPEMDCNAYGRDRGEKGVKSKHYKDADKLATMLADSWTEWVYTFRLADRKWYYTNNPSPTWFKCCGREQLETTELTPKAWEEVEA